MEYSSASFVLFKQVHNFTSAQILKVEEIQETSLLKPSFC